MEIFANIMAGAFFLAGFVGGVISGLNDLVGAFKTRSETEASIKHFDTNMFLVAMFMMIAGIGIKVIFG